MLRGKHGETLVEKVTRHPSQGLCGEQETAGGGRGECGPSASLGFHGDIGRREGGELRIGYPEKGNI